MARMSFKWDEPKINGYDKINPDDFRTAVPELAAQGEKPFIVFVTSDLPDDDQEMKNIESTVLLDESVSIGATLFHQVKLTASKVKEGNPFWKMIGGKELPRMIVIDANGAKVGAVEGKDVTTTKIYGFMKKASSRTYKTDLDSVVKETKTILTEIDQIEAKRTALQTKKNSSSQQKEAEWAKEEKALDEQMKQVEARELALKKKWTEDKKVTKA
jgi:hypothetical protein